MESIMNLLDCASIIQVQAELLREKSHVLFENVGNIQKAAADIGGHASELFQIGGHASELFQINFDISNNNRLLERIRGTTEVFRRLDEAVDVLITSSKKCEEDVKKISRRINRGDDDDNEDDIISIDSAIRSEEWMSQI